MNTAKFDLEASIRNALRSKRERDAEQQTRRERERIAAEQEADAAARDRAVVALGAQLAEALCVRSIPQIAHGFGFERHGLVYLCGASAVGEMRVSVYSDWDPERKAMRELRCMTETFATELLGLIGEMEDTVPF